MKKIWNQAGSPNLMVVLCGLLTLDLAWAYFGLEKNLPIFAPMGDVGLHKWLLTYARYNFRESVWFLLMLVLLVLLAINAFVCTTERMTRLIRRKNEKLRSFGPHIMHYAVLVILLGYLGSYLFSSGYPGHALKPGARLDLPEGGGQIIFLSAEPIVYHGERMSFFDNYILDPGIRLRLVSENETREAELAFNRPIWFNGFDIHLIDFSPRKANSRMYAGGNIRRIKLIIRRDPSSAIYLSGLGFFFVGLLLYGWDSFSKRNARSSDG